MKFLRSIFSDESTAYVGLCKFKTAKVAVNCSENSVKFASRPCNYYATDFSKNVLL